ncbi:mitochondrial carrier [Pleurotus eryngii]|uniref:Mitochondrial carrier n=1 Tax=Pleurotus eryngii TaxID=5323 RepID=A0A9P6DB65_PLEER|nr:mitochondrial carrier [Pleurotus eryngii]
MDLIFDVVDLLKTRIQQGDSAFGPRKVPRILPTALEVVHSHGVLGLWRGTTASLLRNVPGIALYMTSLTQLRTAMANSPYFARTDNVQATGNGSVLPKISTQGNLLAGAVTRVGVGFVLNPFSVVKARFESDMYAYESLTGAFQSISRQGPSEFFRGVLASSLRDAPYAGLFVVFYEAIKRETSVLHSIAAGSAGALATILTHPFDVVKTKIQVRKEERYHGLMRTVRTIWAQRGVSGYFDGVSLRIGRKVLSSAIGWAAYETLLMFMHRVRSKTEQEQ